MLEQKKYKKLCIIFYANEGIKSNKNKYYKYLSDIVAVIMYHKGLFFNKFLCFGTTKQKTEQKKMPKGKWQQQKKKKYQIYFVIFFFISLWNCEKL